MGLIVLRDLIFIKNPVVDADVIHHANQVSAVVFTANPTFIHIFRRRPCISFGNQLTINVELQLIIFGITGVNDVIPSIGFSVQGNLDTVVLVDLDLVSLKFEMHLACCPLPR